MRSLENGKKLLYQFLNWFNFASMVCGWFPLRSGLKIEFVPFEAEKVMTCWGFEIPPVSLPRSASKKTISNFKPFLGGNWPQTRKSKLNQLKNWYNKIFSVFQNSYSLTTHPISASIFTPLGHTNFFETYLTWKFTLHGVKWHSFCWWRLKLKQIILPDRGACSKQQDDTQRRLISYQRRTIRLSYST